MEAIFFFFAGILNTEGLPDHFNPYKAQKGKNNPVVVVLDIGAEGKSGSPAYYRHKGLKESEGTRYEKSVAVFKIFYYAALDYGNSKGIHGKARS